MHSDLPSKEPSGGSGGPKHKGLMLKARKEIDLADHLVYVTMPLTDDVKFMLAVTEHIINSSASAVESLLEQKKYYKNMEAFPKTFGPMIDIWMREIKERYNFENKFAEFLRKLRETRQMIKKSRMRFKRKDKYILTNDVYNLKVLDLESIKKYLKLAKDFIDKSENILKKEESRQGVLRSDE